MGDKLDAGSRFPSLGLRLITGRGFSIPEDLETDYAVVLFYRGHW